MRRINQTDRTYVIEGMIMSKIKLNKFCYSIDSSVFLPYLTIHTIFI